MNKRPLLIISLLVVAAIYIGRSPTGAIGIDALPFNFATLAALIGLGMLVVLVVAGSRQ